MLWKLSDEVKKVDFSLLWGKGDLKLGLPHPRNIFITTIVTQRKSTIPFSSSFDSVCSTTAKRAPARTASGFWLG